MFLLTGLKCPAVGTQAISGFVFEDTLGLEASCRVAFAIAK